MSYNYIKLSRNILSWEWYHDLNTKTVFLHLLLKANWQDAVWRGITIKRGSLVSSYTILSAETGISLRSIRTSISHLLKSGEITVLTTKKYTVFTIVNYQVYQGIPDKPELEIETEHFAKFWMDYPKKEGASKPAAKKEFEYAIERGYSEEDLAKTSENYSDACRILNTPRQFIKLPENFLKDMAFAAYLPDVYQRPAVNARDNMALSVDSYNKFMKRNYDVDKLEKELLK